ncbi:copia [Diplodia corticola]|uniref:Copia n=1 Tax=Diplodia corticola TaxID=236234 RepID=A0A1J9R7A0_9PEZI|nr:copia [Diplodia corticola]OJD36401.1 copia [Diplodia corticola]
MEEFIGYIEAYDIDDGEETRPETLTGEGQESARFPALNPNAWVLAPQGWHHICNNRSLYATFDEIELNPMHTRFGKTGDVAVGIGTIRLPVRLKDGQTLRLPFGEVLFAPTRKANSLSLKRLNHSGTAIDHRSGLGYDVNDRNIMWFPNSGGLPTLRLDGVPDRLYLDNEFTDDEAAASYCDAWIKQQPVLRAINGFAEALQVIARLKEANPRTDPALVRRLLAKRVVNITVEDFVKLLGIHVGGGAAAAAPAFAQGASPLSPTMQPSRPYSGPSARQPLGPRSSAPPNARASMPPAKRLPAPRNEFIRSQWGSRAAFQSSYGLTMTPEDIEEGEAILEKFRRNGLFR